MTKFVLLTADDEKHDGPDEEVASGEDADPEGHVHGVEVLRVEDGLQGLDGGGEAEAAQEHEAGQRGQDADAGPPKRALQSRAGALELKNCVCVKNTEYR